MSQARVTDFFSQRKKGIAGPVKGTKERGTTSVVSRGTRSRSIKNNDAPFLRQSSVHEEFIRVLDEAVGLDDGPASPSSKTAKPLLSSPGTPKRTAADSGFDLGAAVFSATADHSTAKKRRQAEAKANVPEKANIKRKARKKLDLPQDTAAQALASPLPVELTPQPCVSGQRDQSQLTSSPQRGLSKNSIGQDGKALCKEGIATLKSRLHRIKKQAEQITSAASSAPTSPAGSAPDLSAAPPKPHSVPNPTPLPGPHTVPHPIPLPGPHTVPHPTPLPSPHTVPHPTRLPGPHPAPHTAPDAKAAKSLAFTIARANELAAKAQRRKEDKEAEDSKPRETQTQDSSEQQPAYQRYHTLSQAAPPGLSLPYHYKLLAEMFRSMDTVVAMLYNRCETATFTKIKKGVQDMTHKRFEESHVGQVKTVFPEAYTFRQEKNIPTFNSSIKKGSYQLTVEPLIPSDQNEARPVLSATRLLDRRQLFHLNLLSIVKQHHQVFLSSLVPAVCVPAERLTRWHPAFNVDTVPGLPTAPLPQSPHTDKLSTAQEVLDKARSLITPKMEKALECLALKTEDKAVESKEPALPQPAAAPLPTALKGVSQSLLDRIRAKEAQKLHASMTRDPAQEGRLLMLSRLPELARILRSVFIAEKKAALIMELACKRMVGSYRSALSTGEMEKHIRLLAEVAPGWLTVHPIRKDLYLKLNKNMELNIVVDQLNSRLKEEERL